MSEIDSFARFMPLLHDPVPEVSSQAIKSIKALYEQFPDRVFELLQKELDKSLDDIKKCVTIVKIITEIADHSEISLANKMAAFKLCLKITTYTKEVHSDIIKMIPELITLLINHNEDLLDKYLTLFMQIDDFSAVNIFTYYEIIKSNGILMKDRISNDIMFLCPYILTAEARDFRIVFANIFDKAIEIVLQSGTQLSEKTASLMYDNCLHVFFENNVPNTEKTRYIDIVQRLARIISTHFTQSRIHVAFAKIGLLILIPELYDKAVNLLTVIVDYAPDVSTLNAFISSLVEPLIRNVKNDYTDPLHLLKVFAKVNSQQTVDLVLKIAKEGRVENVIKSLHCLIDNNLVQPVSGPAILLALESMLNSQLPSYLRKLVFIIWEKLAELGVDTAPIIQPLFVQASSPNSRDTIHDFESAAIKVAPTLKYPQLPAIAYDTKNISVAHIAFAMMNIMNCNFVIPSVASHIFLIRTLIYVSSPFFSIESRMNILRLYTKLTNKREFEGAVANFDTKRCQFHATKFFIEFVRKLANSTFDSENWIPTAQQIIDGFDSESHQFTPKQKLLSPQNTANLKSSYAIILTGVYMSDINKNQAMQKLQNLLMKCETKFVEESVPFALCLCELRKSFEKIADDVYKQKNDHMQKDQSSAPRRAMQLIYNYKHQNYNDSTADSCLSFDIPPVVAAHAQRKIMMNRGGSVPNMEKQVSAIDRLLGNKDLAVCKVAIDTFYFLLSNGHIATSLTQIPTILKKCMQQLRHHLTEGTKQKIVSIINSTPPEINFANILSVILSEPKFYDETMMKLCSDIVNNATNTINLRTPANAASVAVLQCENEYKEDCKLILTKIFYHKSDDDQFADAYFKVATAAEIDEFIPFMFSFISLPAPWNSNSLNILLRFINTERFQSILDSVTVCFFNAISSVSLAGFLDLGEAIFNMDKPKFIMSLLNKPSQPPRELVYFFALKFDVYGQSLIDAVTFNGFNPKSTIHLAFIKIVNETKEIPKDMLQATYIALIQSMAQSETLLNDGIETVKKMSKYYPLINTNQVQIALNDAARTKTVNFATISALLTVVAQDLNVYNLTYFAKFCPYGALAGYSQIASNERPVLTDIMSLCKSCPGGALLALPSIVKFAPERYGTTMIGSAVDFILSQATENEESFKCMMNLYEWLPVDLVYEKATFIFDAIKANLSLMNPFPYAFNFLTQISDSKTFVGRGEFRQYLPKFIIMCFGFSQHNFTEILTAARTALCSCCRHCAMFGTEKMLMESIGDIKDFGLTSLKTFVREMDGSCIDAAISLVEHANDAVKIKAGQIIIASVSFGRGVERNIHMKVVNLLGSEKEEVKISILKAMKMYPVIRPANSEQEKV